MEKPTQISIDPSSLEYAPTAGIKPLREAVAHLYNDLYRKDKESQYTWENVKGVSFDCSCFLMVSN